MRDVPCSVPECSRRGVLLAAGTLALWGWKASRAIAQPDAAVLTHPADQITLRYEIGVQITASPGGCRQVVAAMPVPMDWPQEQTVRTVHREVRGPRVQATFRTLQGGVKQWLIRVPVLTEGEQLLARLVLDITRFRPQLPPDVGSWRRPRRRTAELRRHLGSSPQIETSHPRIRQLSQQLGARAESDWDRARIFYDWVRANIEYRQGPLKGALRALEDGSGDCEEMTSLFVALCRVSGIPARSVWVPGHSYAEFYLESPQGQGRWFPCQLAGTRAFGDLWEVRPVLQKGDRFRLPELRKTVRYVAEYALARWGRPQVRFFRRRVSDAPQLPVQSETQ